MKELLWLAASAYTMEEFKQHMNALKSINSGAHDWLMKIPPNTWARSHFSCRPKGDLLSNNVCESFNQLIKESRDKPILTMMEMIRRQLMKRFQEKREALTTFTGDLCPKIMEKIEEARLGTTTCDVTLAGEEIFEVVIGVKNAIVDIGKRSCTCRKI